MNQKNIYIVTVVLIIILLIFSFSANSKMDNIQNTLNSQQNNLRNLEWKINELETNVYNITQNIKETLEEQQQIVSQKSFTTLSYDKNTKMAQMEIAIALKEMSKDSSVLLKIEREFGVSTLQMVNNGGLNFIVDLEVSTEFPAKLYTVIDGNIIKEEYLFDINLKELLERRFRIGSSSSGWSHDSQGNLTSYYKELELINGYNKDNALKIEECSIVLKANDIVVYDQINASNRQELFFNDGNEERMKILINDVEHDLNLGTDEDIELELIITVTDNLGLTYSFTEKEFIQQGQNKGRNSNYNSSSGTSTDKISEFGYSGNDSGYSQFSLVE